MIQKRMHHFSTQREKRRDKAISLCALIALCAVAALSVFGPAGIVSWSESTSRLESLQSRIAQLEAEKSTLANRNTLLDPGAVDPDLASELVRRDLGVAHPDEYITTLD